MALCMVLTLVPPCTASAAKGYTCVCVYIYILMNIYIFIGELAELIRIKIPGTRPRFTELELLGRSMSLFLKASMYGSR